MEIMEEVPQLQEWKDGPVGDFVNPIIKDGIFIDNFYMQGRVSAMKGASAKEYQEANMTLGYLGTPYRETHVLGPDEPNKYWSQVIRTSGDLHWNPRWNTYAWSPYLTAQENAENWMRCGRPHKNQFGEWRDGGVTPEMQKYAQMNVFERQDVYGNTSPEQIARKNAGKNHGRRREGDK